MEQLNNMTEEISKTQQNLIDAEKTILSAPEAIDDFTLGLDIKEKISYIEAMLWEAKKNIFQCQINAYNYAKMETEGALGKDHFQKKTDNFTKLMSWKVTMQMEIDLIKKLKAI